MKTRTFALLIILAAAGITAIADDRLATLVLRPSSMKDGESSSLVDRGRQISVTREGADIHVRIEKGAQEERLVISKSDEQGVVIERDGDDETTSSGRKTIRAGGAKITIDGLPESKSEKTREQKRGSDSQRWFMCPKDETMLRVPKDAAEKTYRCPVDGTTMERREGKGFSFWIGEDSIELN